MPYVYKMTFLEERFYRYLGVFFLLIALLPCSARTQDDKNIEFSANVVSRRMNVGEAGSLLIRVTNGSATGLPSRIDAPGLEVVKTGEQFSMIGGRGFQNVYYYQITPTKPGRFTIPSVTAKIKGKDYVTQPIEITVIQPKYNDLAAQATQPYFGRFNLEATEVYTNQLVPFDITVFARGRNSISDVTSAKLKHESFVIKNFSEVKLDAIEISGNLYSFARLPANLFALKPGIHTLGPCNVVISVVSSKPSFGPFSFQRVARQRVMTDVATIKVKPLPDGAPASFTGGVGDFKLTATPSTTSVSVGDPISINFEVRGIGNLGTLGAPHFSSVDNIGLWKTYEPSKTLEPEDASDGLTTGKCTFAQVIIPLKKTTEIPPFELTFFDPAKEQYVTRRTEAIPITVAAAGSTSTTVTFPAQNEQGGTPYEATTSPSAKFSDILHIQTEKPKWQSYTAIVPGSQGGPWFFAFHFLCSLGFFTLLGFGFVRWYKHHKEQQSSAQNSLTFKQSLRSIPSPGAPKREFYHAVSTALDLWKKEHSDAPEKVIRAIDTLSGKCDSQLYAGKNTVSGTINESEASEFLTVLKKLPSK